MAGHSTGDEDWTRIVIHADMDAFFAAVEQLDNPEYRGKPLVVGGRHERSVVSTASYEARQYGLHSAMPMTVALRRCPHVLVIPPRMERYAAVSAVIMEVFRSYSPLVEAVGIDEAFIDVTGAQRLFGNPREIARGIKNEVRRRTGGLTVSVGVATTKFVAKIASDYRKPDGLTIVRETEVSSFLNPLEVRCIWGVGPVTQKKLAGLGLFRIGDVANCSVDDLRRHMGHQGAHIWHLANGIDVSEVLPRGDRKSISKEYTLRVDVGNVDDVWPYLVESADGVARGLRRDGLVAGGIRLKLKRADFKVMTRQKTLAAPSSSADEFLHAARALLSALHGAFPCRLVGLAAINLRREMANRDLFETPLACRQRDLDRVLDRVNGKYGTRTLVRGCLLRDSDVSGKKK